MLIDKAKKEYPSIPLRILGYSPATVSRMNNKYRYKCVMKFRNSKIFREMMAKLLIEYGRNKKLNEVVAYIDVNPDTIL